MSNEPIAITFYVPIGNCRGNEEQRDEDDKDWKLTDPCSFYVFKGFTVVYYSLHPNFGRARFHADFYGTAFNISNSVGTAKDVLHGIKYPLSAQNPISLIMIGYFYVNSVAFKNAREKLGDTVDKLDRIDPWCAYIDFDRYEFNERGCGFFGRLFRKKWIKTEFRDVRVVGGKDEDTAMYNSRWDAIEAIGAARSKLGMRDAP